MGNDMEKYLLQKASAMNTPVKATLELTPLCNMNCRMCYVRHSEKEADSHGEIKPLDYWLDLIPELKDMGVLFAALIGGEPFLYPDLKYLYEALHNNGFYINLTTNGTLLAHEVPEWIIDHKPRYITVSLYGAANETYEKVTGNPRGYTQAMQGIKNLMHAGIPVKLNYVVLPENRNDLEQIFEIKKELDIPLLASAYCFPPVRKAKSASFERLTAEDCAEEELKIMKYSDPDQYLSKISHIAGESYQQDTARHKEHIYCHAGNSTFWITWQGKMVPCGMMKSIGYSAEKGKLKINWELMKQDIAEKKICHSCAVCERREICQACPASMEAETGQLDGRPEYLCRAARHMIDLCKAEKSSQTSL